MTNTPQDDPRSSGAPEGHLPIHRFLSAPALIGDTLVGQVALANSDRDYSKRDLALIERLASLYALAIQRKQVEEALRESEEKFRILLESAPAAIVITSEAGQITLINAAAEEMFGYRRTDLADQPVETLLPEEQRKIHQAEHRPRYLNQPTTRLMGRGREVAGRRKDDTQFPVEVALSYVKTSTGGLIVSYITDISERKRIEAARERELRSLEALSGAPRAAMTAEAFGLVPLHRSAPDTFESLIQQYGTLMDLALEEQVYKVKHDTSTELRKLAETIGLLRGGPRDVVEIHTTALKMKASGVYSQKAQAYADEGRLLMLELMGYLTSYYRNHVMGRQLKRSDNLDQAGVNYE
jgi:PAS domain S-box-containing protein